MDVAAIKEYGTTAALIITTVGGLLVGYRAKRLANKKTEITILMDMISSLETKLKERDKTIDEMRIKMNDIFNQNTALMTRIGHMERDYKSLQKSYNALNKNSNSKQNEKGN